MSSCPPGVLFILHPSSLSFKRLAEIARSLPQKRDNLPQLPERKPAIFSRPRFAGLASQGGQSRPVDRPRLGDGLLLNLATHLIELLDQCIVDRAFACSIRMVVGDRKRRALSPSLEVEKA